MANYRALQTEIAKPAYAGMNNDAIADALNARAPGEFVDVQWSAIREILMSNGDWGSLVYTERRSAGAFLGGAAYAVATQVFAIEFADSCRFGGVLLTSDSDVRSRIGARLNTLAGATVGAISDASRSAIIALVRADTSIAASIGWPRVTEHDIARARSI